MKPMTDAHRTEALKIQAGFKAIKEGLMAMMKAAKADGDADVMLAAQRLYGQTHDLHGQAGQAMMATFTDAAVVVMGPGR